MYDFNRPVKLKTDASDYAFKVQIRYRNNESKLYPIIFYSYKLLKTELNYPIYDKKFLVIVNTFKKFRHYLKENMHQIKVYTDYKNISHFSIIQNLNKR